MWIIVILCGLEDLWIHFIISRNISYFIVQSFDKPLNTLTNKPKLILLLLLGSCSVVPDSLWPHGLQHGRLPCLSLSPRVCSSSRPLSWWCHPTVSSSAAPLSFCLQPFPSESLLHIKWPEYWASASASLLPVNIQAWFPLGLTGLVSLHYPCGLSYT